jgi:hypothetical protein
MKLIRALCLLPPSLAALLLLIPAPRADGCAVAPRPGETVQIADESAIIVWDAATKTEHFIRRATFSSAARDFGFLVPTPTKPELAEAGDDAFMALADLTAPRVVVQQAPSGGAGGGCGCGVMAPMSMSAGKANAPQETVEVLDAKRVAGHDAVVLQADDAEALGKWLKEHGYESSPAITDWLAPYVKAKWKISAFKIAREEEPPAPDTGKATPATGKTKLSSRAVLTGPVSTTALRMSFHTDRPFYPYREPSVVPPVISGPGPGRLLRVYFVADERVKGTFGEDGVRPWGTVALARAVWSDKLVDANRESLLRQLKMSEKTGPATWWVTEFEDHSSPRPGSDDVYFWRDEDQSTLERPPVVQYVSARLPGCVMCYALALFMVVPRLLRLRRR